MHPDEEVAFNIKGKQMNKLLFPCAAIALITMSASAHAGKIEVGTIAVSLGLGFGNTVAQTYGSQANATTTNNYRAKARAGSQESTDENGAVATSETAPNIWSTEAHAGVNNSSTSSVKYNASAKARGFSLGAGWGAFTWSFNQPVHSENVRSVGSTGGTFDRSGAIAGGLSGSYSQSQGHASASGTGTGDATADATNGRGGQSSASSATGGATSTASAGGNNGYSSNTSGGASIGVASSY